MFLMTNFIQRTSESISQKECNAVIDFFETNKERHYEGILGSQGEVDYKSKIDTEITINAEELINDSRLNPVAKALRDACDEYIKKYPFLTKIENWSIFNLFKIQRYNPNEAYFAEHCENPGSIGFHEKRLIAVMVYLNTVTDGGQTHFPTQNISFTPTVGDILMWPAYWTHPHHGIPSPSQVKYIITGWYNFYDQ